MLNDTKTIFVSPIMTKNMYALQSDLHDYMQEFDTKGLEWYCPDRWVPHYILIIQKHPITPLKQRRMVWKILYKENKDVTCK